MLVLRLAMISNESIVKSIPDDLDVVAFLTVVLFFNVRQLPTKTLPTSPGRVTCLLVKGKYVIFAVVEVSPW